MSEHEFHRTDFLPADARLRPLGEAVLSAQFEAEELGNPARLDRRRSL